MRWTRAGLPCHSRIVITRLEKFRGYMARLNPAGSPLQAVREGLYVPRPGRTTAEEIAGRLELDPSSSHLVVGGIGSGKTTQLIVACDRLAALPDTHAEYVDVAEQHDLEQLKPGVLIILAGLALSQLFDGPSIHKPSGAIRQFRRWAHGEWERLEIVPDEYSEWDPSDDDPPSGREYELIHHKPLLVPPEVPIDDAVTHMAAYLGMICKALRPRFPHLVLLFDSLDRLTDPDAFAAVVEQDARAIRQAGVGLVLVGPLGSMYGAHRSITDHFQHFYPQLAVDVRGDAAGRTFLVDLLRKRAPADLLPDASAARLAHWSGGVLRDLVALARSAGEEAYLRGADRIEEEHVDAAADAFGRQLIFGLNATELDVLQRVASKGGFVQTSDQDVALLVTRRVLEYPTSTPRFAVHPTLKPLLDQLQPLPAAS